MIKIRKNSRLKILSSSVALAALTLLTTGCGGDDNNEASVGTVTLVHPGGRATSAAAHPVTVLQSDQPSVYDNQHRRINQNYEHEEPGQIPGGSIQSAWFSGTVWAIRFMAPLRSTPPQR